MRKVIRKMEKIYAALQQNRGNIWSQYFPHCLPSRCSPSTFHSLYASLSHDPLHLSPPRLSQIFFWMSTKKNMISCLYRRPPEMKVRTVLCPQTIHVIDLILSFVESHTCAVILQAATSGATVLKVGVGWGPDVTVYESYVCVFSASRPVSSSAFSSSLVLWFLMIAGAPQCAVCLGKQAKTN